jgi:hypothetical protein
MPQNITLMTTFAFDGCQPVLPGIFSSREGIATIRLEKSPLKSYLKDAQELNVIIEIHDSKIQPDDFIVQSLGNNRYSNIVGIMPITSFPQLWGEWVRNPYVQISAWNHIIGKRAAIRNLVIQAIDTQPLGDAFESWMAVARVMLPPHRVEWIHSKTIGSFGTPKPIGVKAMPIRIANSLKHWVPPVPQPQFNAEQKPIPLVSVPVKQ